jgi:hypothetical protein
LAFLVLALVATVCLEVYVFSCFADLLFSDTLTNVYLAALYVWVGYYAEVIIGKIGKHENNAFETP